MKLTPFEKNIIEKMQPGVLSTEGFLGKDDRHLHEIIEEDYETLQKLNVSQDEIADRLAYFTEVSKEAYDLPVLIDDKYLVQQDIWRGRVLCPFNHKGSFPKTTVTLINKENNLKVVWANLNIHFIKEHCFFEGKGSKYRIEPDLLIKAIF
jgi:hypothetical protein